MSEQRRVTSRRQMACRPDLWIRIHAVDDIPLKQYTHRGRDGEVEVPGMAWTVRFDEDFFAWFEGLDEGLRDEITAHAELLEDRGPNLGRPRVDTLKGSSYPNMKELRIQYHGEPWRIIFAFDPERAAILLVGGNKAGDKRWYQTTIPIAEQRYERHLQSLEQKKGK